MEPISDEEQAALEAQHDALLHDLRQSSPPDLQGLAHVLDRHFDEATQLGFLRQMIYQAADAICVTDRRGLLSLVNHAFCKLVEKPMSEIIGHHVATVIGAEHSEFARVAERLDQGAVQHDFEFILTREGRSPRVLSISMTPLLNPMRGNYTMCVSMARDVTGRWELERQVIEWQERARQYLYALHPPDIAEAMVQGRVEAQNLNATVVFTDITGFTGFTARVPPQEVARALHQYFTAMSQVVLDHNGWVDKFVGDSVMALFGVPGGSPDHARQAALAATAMMAEMNALDLPWRHKVGVASGQVIAGDIGSQQKPTYTAIGDPVNLAARLKDMARPGEVLLCPRTHRQAGDGFRYEDLGELDVRGYGPSGVFRLLSSQESR
jgi:PAS domain S-box-containing protein